MSGIALTVPDELVEQVADLVLDRLGEKGRAAEPDGWLRGADRIAAYIDAPRSRVYALATTSPPRIPVERDGSALIARKSDLDHWIRSGGGKRP